MESKLVISCRMMHNLIKIHHMVRCEARNSWLKPDDCLWLDPSWFNYWFALAQARSVGILAMSPLHCFIIVF